MNFAHSHAKLVQELVQTCHILDDDQAVRVIVITGTDKAFAGTIPIITDL